MSKKYSILYVDDERQNLISFKATFREDYNIFIANSGKEGIELLERKPIDLVISDQKMPEMTGVEFFEKIIPNHPDPMRILLTGYSDMQAIIDSINKGKIYFYISKPWKREELKQSIEKALEAYELMKENKALSSEKEALLVKTERQEKENVIAQLENLKNQVNPHFLFNALNVLSALVGKDAKLARKFVQKLSRVYRYALEHKDQIVVTLSDEIKYIKNYVFLQKIRFNEGLVVADQIAEEKLNLYIPPSAVQLIVENAIKHNVISSDNPLTIEIFVDEHDFLVVKNNLQLREDSVQSTGVGQQNLLTRYQYLSNKSPEFYQKDGFFYSKIPLLEQEI
ncbi:histidine kinase [Flexithrix dorotheae]|uniref:histidine kinase n=1 Tax=Flexithrix dorotheae TaxID=70993 RepID=UPI00035DF156